MVTQQDVNRAFQDGRAQGRREMLTALNGLDQNASCTIGQFRDLAMRTPLNQKRAGTILGLDPVTIARRAPKPVSRPAAVVSVPPATPKTVQPPTAAPPIRLKPTEDAASMGARIAAAFNGAEHTATDDSPAAMGQRIAAQFEGRKEAVA